MRNTVAGFQMNLSRGKPQLTPDVVSHLMSFNIFDQANASRFPDAVIKSRQLQKLADQYWLMGSTHEDTVRMSLPTTDVHISRALEKMLISYPNREYVADEIVPVVPVGKRFDSIFQLPAATMQTAADVIIAGQRARPNEVKYTIDHNTNYNVKDYGLIDFVSKDEVDNADQPLRPYDYAQRVIINMLMIAREIRVRDLMQLNTNYGTNTAALTGGQRFDTATGDPVPLILNGIESCFVTPNVLWMGGQVWPYFRTNPNVTKYVLGRPSTKNGATPLVVDKDTVAQAFGVDRVIVGRAKVNTAAEGATVSSGYIWGKDLGICRWEAAPNPRESNTFANTFRFGQQTFQVQVIPELLHGVRGGDFVKVTHSDDEIVIGGSNSGYLLETVIT